MNSASELEALVILAFYFGIGVVFYFIAAYVFWRLGRRFRDEGFFMYCIPIYNYYLLCKCAGVSGWHTLAMCIPIVHLGASTWVFGNIARRLGKSFWAYGLGAVLLAYIPVLVLAFGDGAPAPDVQPDVNPDFPSPPSLHPNPFYVQPQAAGLRLRCLAGDNIDAEYPMSEGALVIGRDPRASNIVLTSSLVSGSHASVRSVGTTGDWVLEVEDLNSANGTTVLRMGDLQWRKVSGRTVVNIGDRIRIADGVAEFQVMPL